VNPTLSFVIGFLFGFVVFRAWYRWRARRLLKRATNRDELRDMLMRAAEKVRGER
jgi:uncharacterized membrane protein YccC